MKTRSILVLLSALVSSGAASAAKSTRPHTLHYEVKVSSASFGDMGARKLWVKGNKMRWEQESARLPIQIIKNEKGVFLLHPWNKIAAEYPKGSPRGNPRALLPGPTGSPKAFLKHVRAVKHGREKVAKQLCDVYDYTDAVTKRKCRLWLSVKSGKPVRLLVKGEQAKVDTVTATYTKFVEGIAIPDSLFELPKGYAIRPMPIRKLTSDKEKQPNTKPKSSG